MEAVDTQTTGSRLEQLTLALDRGAAGSIRQMLASLHAAEIADLLESYPREPREILWELVEPDVRGEVLVEVNDEVRAGLISLMESEQLVAAAGGLDTADLADLIADLPGAVTREVLRSMDKQNLDRLEAVLHYPEDTAGGLMNVDTVTVRSGVTLDVVLRYLRVHVDIPETTDKLFVVDRNDVYKGILRLSALLTNDPELLVVDVMDRDVQGIPSDMPDDEVARLFEDRNLISAPVVDLSLIHISEPTRPTT